MHDHVIDHDLEHVLKGLEFLSCKPDGKPYSSPLKALAKSIGINHPLAQSLWDTNIRNARELALHIADKKQVTESFLEHWVKDIDEWGLCDGFTARLVRGTPFAVSKAHEWTRRESLYQRRAGFSLMAQMAWQKNDYEDAVFIDFLLLVEKYAFDSRPHVKKAVNWALRDIGKRNAILNRHARQLAQHLQNSDNKTVQWVGRHRINEVTDR